MFASFAKWAQAALVGAAGSALTYLVEATRATDPAQFSADPVALALIGTGLGLLTRLFGWLVSKLPK